MDGRVGFAVIMAGMMVCAGGAWGQRVEFQRQRFDRSRFSRVGAAAGLQQGGSSVEEAEPVAEPVAAETAATAETAAPAAGTGTEGRQGWSGGQSWTNRQGSWNGGMQQTWPGGARLETNGVLSTGVPAALVESPKFELVPKKWFDKADEWEEAKELQKETGACILLYFKDPSDSGQKGLCNWFEKHAATYKAWRKAMPYFIKIQITLPGNTETREFAREFKFNSTPAWYVLRPDGKFPKRLQVIQYGLGGKDPEPMPEKTLIPALHELCPAAYDNLF